MQRYTRLDLKENYFLVLYWQSLSHLHFVLPTRTLLVISKLRFGLVVFSHVCPQPDSSCEVIATIFVMVS